MKNCINCNAPLDDKAMFCHNCGTAQQPMGNNPQQPMGNNQQQPNVNPNYAQPYQANPVADGDHTAEFSAKDVSDNKLFALLIYLSSIIGIVIAVFANNSKKSAYLDFHIKQGMKIFISQLLVGVASGLLSWTCIVPVAGAICVVVLTVVSYICFFKTCVGKSIEAPIVKGFSFLK